MMYLDMDLYKMFVYWDMNSYYVSATFISEYNSMIQSHQKNLGVLS